ncbi:MAG TPA: rhodanese-like domain-containing protein [Acidimicrobiales bacterium]|nr:rhodanese-like domain-containing protein [Acidimicrobiales bacterium]
MNLNTGAPEAGLEELAEALAEGAVLIDVRMPEEFEDMHVPGAVHMPLSELSARSNEIPRDRRVYVICATGSRSLAAAGALNRGGWDTVSVAEGTKGWFASGRPVESGVPR